MAAKKKTSKKTAKKKLPLKKKKAAKKKATPKKVPRKKVAKKKTAKKKLPLKKKKAATKKTFKKAAVKNKTITTTKKKNIGMAKVTKINTRSKNRAKIAKKTKIAPYKEKKGDDYMGVDQTEHFRNILNTWKRDLMQEVDRTVNHMQDEASNFPDPSDRASQEEEFALELRTRDRERKLIRKIDEAMLALDSGDYGFCDVCGIDIGVRRLEARPTATQCIDCKTLDEIKERQLG